MPAGTAVLSLPRAALVFAVQLLLILVVMWFLTRRRPGQFRIRRVIGLTLLCLATSLPFAFAAWWLWPWDWESKLVKAVILTGVFLPLVTAYVLGLLQRRKRLGK